MLQVRALWACIPELLSALEDSSSHRAACSVTVHSMPATPSSGLDPVAAGLGPGAPPSSHRRAGSACDSNSMHGGQHSRTKTSDINGVLAFDPHATSGHHTGTFFRVQCCRYASDLLGVLCAFVGAAGPSPIRFPSLLLDKQRRDRTQAVPLCHAGESFRALSFLPVLIEAYPICMKSSC